MPCAVGQRKRSFAVRVFALMHPFWTRSDERVVASALLIAIIGLTLGLVYLNVQYNFWNRDGGHTLPEGLKYIDSWVEPNFSRCFQLMECNNLRLIQEWVLSWRGLGASFEIVPVLSSRENREVVARYLEKL